MKTKSIKNSFNLSIFLILIVINVAIKTSLQKTYIKKENNSLKAKNLKTSTAYYQLENGDECDSNYNCKSHYCGYNGPVLYDSPEDYTLYACMKKHSKAYNEPCWHDGECKQHKGLLFYWSKCTGIWDIKYRREEYRCK